MNGPEGFLPKNQNFMTEVARILWYRPIQCYPAMCPECDGFPGVSTIPGQPTSRRYTALSLVSLPSPGPHWLLIGPYPDTGDILSGRTSDIYPTGLSAATTKLI